MHQVKSRDQWTQLVQRFQELSISQKLFCEQEGIKLATFGYWYRKLTKAEIENTVTCIELPNIGILLSDEVLKAPIQSDEIQIPLPSGSASVIIRGSINIAQLAKIVEACSGNSHV